jgi:SAM-dependent methyltransferase
MSKQAKDVFLESEGDAWFHRNRAVAHRDYSDDRVVRAIASIRGLTPGSKFLEVGCGGGERLSHLQNVMGYSCSGLEPSAAAVTAANKIGVNAVRGTADRLPFADASFDVVVFGFCLVWCDRQDLFRIASEADRVLREPGWLIIYDFYADQLRERPYHHKEGLFSYKMDYSRLFLWHPGYKLHFHEVRHHEHGGYTDDPDHWVGLSVLRKTGN